MKDPTTYSVVEKDKGGRYTRWALLHQDILKFSVFAKQGSSFKERELAKWLLYKNLYYINYYKDLSTKTTTKNNRTENILDGIKDKLNDLTKLGLLESSTMPAEKGFGNVRVCKCTTDGRLLAWMIESIEVNKRERAYDEAYNILQNMLSAEPQASFEILYSTLYKKYKDKNLFGEFVMDPLRRSLESQHRSNIWLLTST